MCGGPLKCGGPCSAEHVRTLVNPALQTETRLESNLLCPHPFLQKFTGQQNRGPGPLPPEIRTSTLDGQKSIS